MIQSSYKLSERFPSLVLFGIAIIFISHIFVNVGMTVNLLPVKGLPLPFLSYGGSHTLFNMVSIGILMNISNYTNIYKYSQTVVLLYKYEYILININTY